MRNPSFQDLSAMLQTMDLDSFRPISIDSKKDFEKRLIRYFPEFEKQNFEIVLDESHKSDMNEIHCYVKTKNKETESIFRFAIDTGNNIANLKPVIDLVEL